MTISFVGSAGVGVDTGNPVLVLPTGISFGDAVGAVGICSSAQTLTAPAGWSVRSGWPKTGGNAKLYAWTKDSVAASDAGTSHTFTTSGNNKVIVECFVLHSGNGFPADWTDALSFTAHGSTGTSYTAPAATSTAAGDWGVAVFAARGTGPYANWVPSTGLVERLELSRTGSGATSLQLCDSGGSIGAAGTTWGPFTQSNISTAAGGGITWLVKENATSTPANVDFHSALGLHLDQTTTALAADLDHLVTIGAQAVWVVLAIDWAFPSSTTIDATVAAKYDAVINGADTRGLPVIVQAHGCPTWVNAAGTWHGPDTSTERSNWVACLHAFINRYGAAKIDWVEVWNEPNLATFWTNSGGPSPANYVRLLQAAYVDIKASWPTVQVVGHNASRNDIGWVNACYTQADTIFGSSTAAANDYYFDVLGVHPYCGDSTSGYDPADTSHADEAGTGGGGLDPDYTGYRRMRDAVAAKEGAGKPLGFGEFGYAVLGTGWFKTTEANRQTYLATAVTLARNDQYVSYLNVYYHWTDETPVDYLTSFNIHGTGSETAFTAAAITPGVGGTPGTLYPKLGLWRNHDTDGAWSTRMAAATSTYGPFQGHWSQYYDAGSLPIGSDVETAFAAGHDIHIFWKAWDTSWGDTASGGYNTEIDTVAADVIAMCSGTGRKIWLTLHHEPEDDYATHGGGTGWTAANYRGMWSTVRSRFDTAGASQYVTWVLVWQNSHSNPSNFFSGPGQGMVTLYGNDGVMDGLVDIVSQQDYIAASTTPATIATKWLEDLEFLVTNAATGRHWSYLSKPQAFTEWGADLGGVRGTNTHRAQTIDAIRGILPDLAARNVAEIRYFDARSDAIDDPPSADGVAFQALKGASEAGQSTGPVAGAGVALARDGATTTSNTISFVLPAGWQQGDYAVVWLSTPSNPTMTTPAAGWKLEEGPVYNSTTEAGWRYSKTLTAGEPNPSWVISQSIRGCGIMVVLRGMDPATPVHLSTGLTTTASSTSHAAPSISPTAASYLLSVWLLRWADASGNGGVNYATAPITHTVDGSVSVNSAALPGAGALVAHLTSQPVTPGTYGPYTATVPVASTGLCAQLAILPATVAGQVALVGVAPAAADLAGNLTVAGAAPTPPAGAVPAVNVQIAPTSAPMDPSPVWVDLPTSRAASPGHYVIGPVQISQHGRNDELSEVTPTVCTIPLWNGDGAFTGGRPGPYGTLKVGCRIRVVLTYNSVVYERFQGHVNNWPVDWSVGGGTIATCEITATDRGKRLGRPGTLRSMLEQETLVDAPAAYYPLSEADGATSAGSIAIPYASSAKIAQYLGSTGGLLSFGQGTGPGLDGLSAVTFEPVSQTNGKDLQAYVSVGSTSQVSLSYWFATQEHPSPNEMALCQLIASGSDALGLAISLTGQVMMSYLLPDGLAMANSSPQTYNDGDTHQAVVTLTRSGSTVTARLYVDGVLTQTATFTRATLPTFNRLVIGAHSRIPNRNTAPGPFAGTGSHAAAFSTALSASRVAVQWRAGHDGLAGERVDLRLHRICDWSGIPATDRAFDVADKLVGGQATAGKQAGEVMAEAVAAEQGVLFVRGDGKLAFHRRGRRYNTTATFTLDAAQPGQVGLPATYPGDDLGLVNDMEVTRSGGATQRAINQTSITTYGVYTDSLEAPSVSDDEALAVAQWRVGQYGAPLPRLPALTVSLARLHRVGNTTLIGQLLAADISTVIHLANLPTQAPATSDDEVVEGWSETLDRAGGWAISFTTSPHSVDQVGQVGVSAVNSGHKVAL